MKHSTHYVILVQHGSCVSLSITEITATDLTKVKPHGAGKMTGVTGHKYLLMLVIK